MIRREINFYYTALSAGEAVDLILSAMRVLLLGNRGFGSGARKFEEAWRNRFPCHDAIAFPSARVGLHHLLRSLGVGQGDEVILTAFTCIAVPVPVLECGAVPVYADIDPSTMSLDPRLLERVISPRCKALIIQHSFGIPAAMPDLLAIAKSHGLAVIEDACLALNSRLDGKPLGTFGDASIFSFELSKALSAGWGGLVQLNRAGLSAEMRRRRDGMPRLSRWKAARRLAQAGFSFFLYHPALFGWSKYVLAALFKLGLFQRSTSPEEMSGRFSAAARSAPDDGHWHALWRQLQRLDEIVDRGVSVVQAYRQVLESHGRGCGILEKQLVGMRLLRFPVLVQDPEGMRSFFHKQGIELGNWFDAPISPAPRDWERFNYRAGLCPVAEKVSKQIANLPLHPRLSGKDVQRICGTLEDFLTRLPPLNGQAQAKRQ